MGGAADYPQRSSSPLKRPASDLDQEPTSNVDQQLDTESPPQPNNADGAQPQEQMEIHEGMGTGDPVPVDEQISIVTQMINTGKQRALQAGDKTYIISQQWLSRVQGRGSTAKVGTKDEVEGEIGPIDNSDIIQEILQTGDGQQFVRLKHDLARFGAFEYFPEEAWNYVMDIYGLKPGQIAIVRYAVNTNPDKTGLPNIEYELHPPVFVVHRLWSAVSPIPIPQVIKAKNPAAPIFIASRGDGYMEFLKKIKRAAHIELSTRVQVWKVARTFAAVDSLAAVMANEPSPHPSPRNTPEPEVQNQPQDSWRHLLVDVKSFTALQRDTQRELVPAIDQTMNANYNGHRTMEMAELGSDAALVLDEYAETDFLSKYVNRQHKTNKVPVTLTRPGATQLKPVIDSGRSSPAPSVPMTRGRSQKTGRALGAVGLSNLGNTCYMNSALQCVRSVEELTKYFLTHQAEKEINRDNPLAHNGEVAVAYNALLEDIYRDPPSASVVPRYFKNTIGRYAPSFSGYGQQDSQEFLGFLLDGLQEDLSRVKKKPYIEKPDSTDEMVGNPEAIREMAAKVWDITKKRDDSVIADLFTGMYKSTLVCPICAKVSITFDPFNNLTLQLPIENSWTHDIYYFPLNDRPVLISVDMDKQGSIKALKEFISARVDVPVERLFIAEEFKSRFYKFYDDMKPVSEEISGNDQVAVYELEAAPSNWPPPKKPTKQKVRSMLSFSHYDNDSDNDEVPSWDDPMAERMLVPVIFRNASQEGGRYRKPWVYAPVPHFIMLTPAEARSEDVIRRKILEKVETLTTYAGFNDEESDSEDGKLESPDQTDPDLVITTASDVESSGDSKVIDKSVDGEEGMVDVIMKETVLPSEWSEAVQSGASKDADNIETSESRKRKFRTSRPRWLDPKEHLPASLQNMFELSYYMGSKELLPTGWNSVDEEKQYPRLSSREPRSHDAMEEDSEEQDGQASVNGRADSDEPSDVDEDDMAHPVVTRDAAGESTDEDGPDSNHMTTNLPVRPHTNKILPKKLSRFGDRLFSRKDRQQNVDQGPLIRLGEGIVVDWNPQAYSALFDGDVRNDDAFHGKPTYTNIPLLEDPVLDAKRKARSHRKKKGLTLDECLDEFGKEEILSEMDTWYCPRCKEHRRASKKFELWKTPDILVMHLKRFSSSAMRRDKLDVFVDFPIEGLDLSSRVVEREEGKLEIYDLFAVDDHWGGLGGGHYTAFAKSFIDGKWYEYNDSSVSEQKDTSRIVSSGAYLLFYRRRSDIPLGGPRFKEIIEQFDKPQELSEEGSESGEDQRLVVDSSLPGSSSASNGVGVVHPAAGSAGAATMRAASLLTSGGVALPSQTTIKPADLDDDVLPSYQDALGDDDAAPLITSDAVMNDGILDSIDDEGIDLDTPYVHQPVRQNKGPLIPPSWNFQNLQDIDTASSTDALPSGLNSEFAGGSDIVQNDSSASDGEYERRKDDFENAELDADYRSPTPIPEVSEQDQMAIFDLHSDLLQSKRGTYDHMDTAMALNVPAPNSDDGAEPDAEDIHVEKGEGLTGE